MKELTTVDDWDKAWRKQQIDNYIEERIDSQILKLIKPTLKEKSKVIEIGCVPGGKLKFLKQNFDIDSFGLDYSWFGLTNSLKGLNLVCADLSHPPFLNSFDLVYSMGVIEHFEKPQEAIKFHVNLTKKDGLILITIPNFSRFSTLTTCYKIGRRFEGVKKTHNLNIMDLKKFRNLFSNMEIEILLCDYFGPPMIYLPPNFFLKRLRAKINLIIDLLVLRSSIFSPYLVMLGRKL